MTKPALIVAMLLLTAFRITARDTSYIASHRQGYTVKAFVTNDFLSVTRDYSGKENTYKSNRPAGIGVGLYSPWFGMSFSYGFDWLAGHDKGHTRSLDIQYTYYGSNFFADVIIQSHKGFYLDAEDITIYPDMSVSKYGIFGTYVSNSDEFSYKAAFNNSEIQKKSAGSFIAGGGLNYISVSGLGRVGDIPSPPTALNMLLAGPFAGYAYCWIIGSHFYANIGATLGIDFAVGNNIWGIYPSVIPRISFGFDNSKIAIYFNYKNHIAYPVIKDPERIGVSSGTMNLGAAFRF